MDTHPHRGQLTVVAVVVAVGLVGAGLWIWSTEGSSPAKCAAAKLPPKSQVIVVFADCQSTTVLPADSFQVFQLSLFSDHMTMLGQYSANGTIGSYMVNDTEISVIELNPHPSAPPPAYYWAGGVAATGNFSVPVPPSPVQYYLMIENLHSAPVSILWTATLQLVVLSSE